MRARTLFVAVLVAALGARATAACADARPEIIAAIGATAAAQGAEGSGVSLGLTFQWPLADRIHMGVTGFLDDLGDRTGRLLGPGGEDLGPVSVVHQVAKGLAWRAEGHTAWAGPYQVFATSSWGVYRVREDVRGVMIRRTNAPGIAVGAGLKRVVTATHEAAIALRYQQLWRGTTQRYLSAALEWRWHHHGN